MLGEIIPKRLFTKNTFVLTSNKGCKAVGLQTYYLDKNSITYDEQCVADLK